MQKGILGESPHLPKLYIKNLRDTPDTDVVEISIERRLFNVYGYSTM